MMFRTALFAMLSASALAFAPSTFHNVQSTSRTSLHVAIDTSEIKNGLTVELDGEPYKVLNFSIMKQARGAAKTTIKFKNLMRGNTIENTYRSGEKFETAQIDRKPAQYTYADELGNFFFMDSESFEEIMVEKKLVDDNAKWIVEGMECQLVYFKGNVIECVPPSPYIYEITDTEPNMKGNTSQGYTKPATIGNGAVISVPGFIEQGERIKVDTEKGEYIEREK
jgi:elongation factor P